MRQNCLFPINKKIIIRFIKIISLILFLGINVGCGQSYLEECPQERSAEENSELLLNWNWIIEPQTYKNIIFLDENIIGVQNYENKWALMTVDKELITDFQYDSVSGFCDGIAVVNGNSYIDEKGNIVIDNNFDACRSFSEMRSAVMENDKWGFIDTDGNVIIPIIYDNVGWFKDNVVPVKIGDKWGIIDNYGNVVLDCVYDEIRDFQEGYAAVLLNGKWGFVNTEGTLCVDCIYNEAGNFSEKKAAVQIDSGEGMESWAYIDGQGDIVISPNTYSAVEGRMIYIGEFHDGVAFVSKDLYCIIDSEGNNVFLGDSKYFISTFEYDSKYNIIPGYIYTDEKMTKKKYGFLGLHGEERMEAVFDYIDSMNGKYIIVSNIIDGQFHKGLIEIK